MLKEKLQQLLNNINKLSDETEYHRNTSNSISNCLEQQCNCCSDEKSESNCIKCPNH